MGIKVCKFGGTSLTDATQMRKVCSIVANDDRRRYIVVSAPGKGIAHQHKITDLLYRCHALAHAQDTAAFDNMFEVIADRYLQITNDLRLALNLAPHLAQIKTQIADLASAHTNGTSTVAYDMEAAYVASRGEYLCGLIVSKLLNCAFVDATEIIYFDEHGMLAREATRIAITSRLADVDRAVIPGFYGQLPDGTVHTFSRGGSDVTGALVAQGVGAEVYENWTDVSGLLMTDPHIVPNAKIIDMLTYRELRELAYMGATVVHEDAIFPVRAAGIRINIRNTNDPSSPGTMIVPEAVSTTHLSTISGIAGRKNFTVIAVEKAMMNSEIGFGRRLLGVLEHLGISYEHTPSGIDTMSVVIADEELEGNLNQVIQEIRQVCMADAVEAYPNMALIATVGRAMAYTPGIAAKLFTALGNAGINIRMIDQGSSELNIIVGVEAANFEKAVRAIYDAFVI